MKKDHRRTAWLAWHIEALARQKRLPDIEKLTGQPKKAQSPDEMLALLDKWVSSHNKAIGAHHG